MNFNNLETEELIEIYKKVDDFLKFLDKNGLNNYLFFF